MKAQWNNKVIAQTDKENLIQIEGNWYFPLESVDKQYLTPSEKQTTCFWKGESSYSNVVVDGKINEDAAWYYSKPKEGAIEKVGKDFTNYVSFWHGVEVS